LIAALAVLALPTAAQDGGMLGLTGEDLGLMEAAYDNSLGAPQWTFDWSVSLTADIQGEAIDVFLDGSGGFDDFNENLFITVNGDAGGTPIEGELRIAEELVLARATDPTSGADTGWFAVNLNDLLELDINFDAIGEEGTTAFLEGAGTPDFDPMTLAPAAFAFMSIDPSQYIATFREDEGNLTTFTLDLSLSDLFRADGMTDITADVAAAFGEELPPMEAAGVNGILAELLADTIISASQTFDTSASVVDSSSILLSTLIDPAAIGESGGPINVVFTFDVVMTSYNEEVVVEVPADFTEIPVSLIESQIPAEFMGAGAGMSSGDADGPATSLAVNAGEFSCFTQANEFYSVGTTISGTCPANCDGTVWGTTVYTDDSSVCTAAIHAGAIPASGGLVVFSLVDGQDSYVGTASNGVSTLDYGTWGGSFVFDTPASSGGGSTTGAAGGAVSFPNSYTFSSGLTFGFPAGFEIQTESDVVTVVWQPNTPNFIQVYDMAPLFGGMDMGRDFFKDTYGQQAATTFDFTYDAANYQEVELDGKQFSVLDFQGTGGAGPNEGRVVIVPLDEGGYTYVLSFANRPAPANFYEDTLDVARSIGG
jgi:hypothetical protein